MILLSSSLPVSNNVRRIIKSRQLCLLPRAQKRDEAFHILPSASFRDLSTTLPQHPYIEQDVDKFLAKTVEKHPAIFSLPNTVKTFTTERDILMI